MKTYIQFVAFALLAASSTFAASEEADIRKLIKQYEAALNTSDVTRVLKLYGESPTFMPQHAPAQVGRDAVKAAYEHVFTTIDLDIDFTTHEVEVVGDTAWARTSSSGTTTIFANKVVIPEGNNELFVFKRESGHWKIDQYLFATNQPRQ